MSNISKKIQSINKQIEQATDCKQLAKVQQSAEKQLKKLLESLQKSLEKLKPMKEAGDSISEPSADPSKLLKTVQDIIKWIQLTVKTITDEITQVMADIAEITAILSLNPKPQYQNDEERIYGLSYKNFEVKFKCNEKEITVIEIE